MIQYLNNHKELGQRVLEMFQAHPDKRWSRKEIRKHLRQEGIRIDKQQSIDVIAHLLAQGKVIQLPDGRFRLRNRRKKQNNDRKVHSKVTGTISTTAQGFAFVMIDNSEEEIFIPPRRTSTALHGDRVEVMVYAVRPGKRREGAVTRILERARTTFVGVLRARHSTYFVAPDHPKIHVDFVIPETDLGHAQLGDKVVVELVDWPASSSEPIGKIITVLGRPGDSKVEMEGLLIEFQLPTHFPENVLQEANALPDIISPAEIQRRRDMRNIPTFTIDPATAKDFDDAISIRPLEKGWWEVGIHIADVSYYVQPGSALDQEAARRATSVYLVDRVIPMLPERLSNEICSLNPKEDKLTFSVVIEINMEGQVRKSWIGRTVIQSDRRFTYEDAQEIIETGRGNWANPLQVLNQIANAVRTQRLAQGAISFETPEVYFELDDTGAPIAVHLKVRKDAHLLIEDFMLLANKTVARFLDDRGWNGKKQFFAFRFHDVPPEEKMETFRRIARQFGYSVDTSSPDQFAASLKRVMAQVEGKDEQYLLRTLAVRSMSKAFYTTRDRGHYGLAFSHYTHFTSPIRRYPDLIVHRLIDHYLRNGNTPPPWSRQDIERLLIHASRMEVWAEEAERASIQLKQVEFMKRRIGAIFEGVISGVAEWGLFVEILDTRCEGLVPIESIADDIYVFDAENFLLRGKHLRKTYQLGDRVVVRLESVDMVKRHINFTLVSQ